MGKRGPPVGHPPYPGGGRPKKEIDEEQVLKLARLLCTHSEIAAHFEVSTETIANRFSDLIKKGYETGRQSLRRMQWKSAMDGNVAMQIWLGKQLLSQREPDKDDSKYQNPPIYALREKCCNCSKEPAV